MTPDTKSQTPIELPKLPEKDTEAFGIVEKYLSNLMQRLQPTATEVQEVNFLAEERPIIDAFLRLAQEPQAQHTMDMLKAVIQQEKLKYPVCGWSELSADNGLPPAGANVTKGETPLPSYSDIMQGAGSPNKSSNITHG